MESPTPDMDNLLEGLLPEEDLLKNMPNDASEIMKVALNHYKAIVNLTGKKGITIDMRSDFRNNAMALVKLITKQNLKMAQLEGRIFELEKAASSKVNAPIIVSAQTANEAIKSTFAALQRLNRLK
ncbi:hypothetical protein CDAR_188961 [Caerostris darwini]|uniref:Uncharacterized protein n=1 Tax=Caerostris darwini TaxID=1538125 RepID=A0AAV4QTR9_9ARAC|nr:hypothetical protein CDAR_188961 [Caerostris darwini]